VKRAKGVKKCVTQKSLQYEDYLSVLNEQLEKVVTQHAIQPSKLNIFSTQTRKLALSSRDDKRWIAEDGITIPSLGSFSYSRPISMNAAFMRRC
jgi:hypothetical protein